MVLFAIMLSIKKDFSDYRREYLYGNRKSHG